jgi:hypothetical protein
MVIFMVSWNVLIPYWEVLHSPFCAVLPQALTQLQFFSFPRVGMGKYNDTEKHKQHMWTELSALSSPFASLSLTCYEVWLSQDTLIDNAKEQANSLSNMIAQATK